MARQTPPTSQGFSPCLPDVPFLVCASDQVNDQEEIMATKEQPVILKARVSPMRLSPHPATNSNARCTASLRFPHRPYPRDALASLSLSLAPPSTPPATLLTSFRFGPVRRIWPTCRPASGTGAPSRFAPRRPPRPPISPSSPPHNLRPKPAAPLLCTPALFPSGRFCSHPQH